MLRQKDGILFSYEFGEWREAVVVLPVYRGARPLPQKKQMYFSSLAHGGGGEKNNQTKQLHFWSLK